MGSFQKEATMEAKPICRACKRAYDPSKPWEHRDWCLAAALDVTSGGADPHPPGIKPLPYKTQRPKRRRKGQLNDGEWAPGYGPKREKPKP
jgi:hypothetical protein